MFKTGSIVLYGSEGICEIVDITEKTFNEVSALFYVLAPIFSRSSTFFVPTENEKLTSKMKPALSFDKLKETVIKSSALKEWQNDDALRKEDFKAIISNSNMDEIVSMYKTIANHKKEIEKSGKKLHRMDESAFKDATKIIYEEFSLYTDITKDDVEKIMSGEF